MHVHFYKYEGCGNDFILLDNRKNEIKLSHTQIKIMCDRHFGIGADGLMLLENTLNYDFKMVYYNSDGNESSMCGNGGRCIVAFAQKLGLLNESSHFAAIDGIHESFIDGDSISLKMNDVTEITKSEDGYFLDTGSPHVVKWVNSLDKFPVFQEGKKIRNSHPFSKTGGTNVNFIEQKNGLLYIRTYERGVEDETLACGTGVTAAALVEAIENESSYSNFCDVQTQGGRLLVTYQKHEDNSFTDIWLKGPATFVFEGDYSLS